MRGTQPGDALLLGLLYLASSKSPRKPWLKRLNAACQQTTPMSLTSRGLWLLPHCLAKRLELRIYARDHCGRLDIAQLGKLRPISGIALWGL